MDQWWPRLRQETRDWLMANNGDELPASVVEEITQVGGASASDAFSVGEQGSGAVFLTDEAVDWVEAVANGETPSGP